MGHFPPQKLLMGKKMVSFWYCFGIVLVQPTWPGRRVGGQADGS
jgi:hypothetical protein